MGNNETELERFRLQNLQNKRETLQTPDKRMRI
jgi:hypothetical protein